MLVCLGHKRAREQEEFGVGDTVYVVRDTNYTKGDKSSVTIVAGTKGTIARKVPKENKLQYSVQTLSGPFRLWGSSIESSVSLHSTNFFLGVCVTTAVPVIGLSPGEGRGGARGRHGRK